MPSLSFRLRRPEFLDRWNAAVALRLARVRLRLSPWWSDPGRRRRARRAVLFAGPPTLLALGVGAWLALRPVPCPDFENDGLDDIFNYTLLTDEFNKMSVAQRLELIGTLVKRLQGMSPSDSAMMAAFAAGIAGSARQQIEKNVGTLAIDVFDDYAQRYAGVPDEQRETFIEQAFVEFSKTMESIGGVKRDVSDQQRLDEARREARRQDERLGRWIGRNPERAGADLGRGIAFMADRMRTVTNSAQRGRVTGLMRDMTRHFRGQDIRTGKPLP